MAIREHWKYAIFTILVSYTLAELMWNYVSENWLEVDLSIEIESNDLGLWQLFYNSGKGYSETFSHVVPQRHKEAKLVFPLPMEDLHSLRLDPPDKPANTISIDNIALRQFKGLRTQKLDFSKLIPSNSIESISRSVLKTTGLDPQSDLQIIEEIVDFRNSGLINKSWFWKTAAFVLFGSLLWLTGNNQKQITDLLKIIASSAKYTIPVSILGGLLSCYFAFMNGFPIMYSDTGAHIFSGYDLHIPTERTVMYGWLIRATGFSANPFLPIIFQGAIATFLIYRIYAVLSKDRANSAIWALISVGALSLFTSYGWFASLLLPDFTCALAPLCLVLITIENNKKWGYLIIVSLVFLLLNICHTSSMAISLVASFIFFTLKALVEFPNINWYKLFSIALAIVSFPILIFINFFVSGKAELLENQPLFMAARFIEMGLIQEKLDHDPTFESFHLKKHRHLILKDGDHFLWNEGSVKHLIPRETLKSELEELKKSILKDPRAMQVFLKAGFMQTLELVSLYDYASHAYTGAYVERVIQNYLPQYEAKIKRSKQWNWKLNPLYQTKLNFWLTGISGLLICASIVFAFLKNKKNYAFILTALISIVIINAFICGYLSALHSRYHLRSSWLLVFGLFIVFHMLFSFTKTKNLKTHTN